MGTSCLLHSVIAENLEIIICKDIFIGCCLKLLTNYGTTLSLNDIFSKNIDY